jgi:hypothetical protein
MVVHDLIGIFSILTAWSLAVVVYHPAVSYEVWESWWRELLLIMSSSWWVVVHVSLAVLLRRQSDLRITGWSDLVFIMSDSDRCPGLAQEEDGDFTWVVAYLVKWIFRGFALGVACWDSVLVASGTMRWSLFGGESSSVLGWRSHVTGLWRVGREFLCKGELLDYWLWVGHALLEWERLRRRICGRVSSLDVLHLGRILYCLAYRCLAQREFDWDI